MALFYQHWLTVAGLFWAVWVGLPFMAPVFMHLGWTLPANLIYLLYSFQCHQLPERSFFLFGRQFTYSLPQIQSAFQPTNDPAVLRQFIGSASMGWKVAWSDRMVAMYSSILVFMGLWAPLRRKLQPLPLWGFLLLLVPMAIDGFSHLISDLSGLQQGFRFDNIWLANLTLHQFPASFYIGDAWGSFNSIMRLATGVLFGLAIAWYCLPRLAVIFDQLRQS